MRKRLTKEEFIERAVKIHGNKYNYSKVEYKNNITKVCIICPKHGEFWQTPLSHLQGSGCELCTKTHRLTTEEFIEKSKQKHGDKYNYSKVKYKNNHTKVCIICPEHGEFYVKPMIHLRGSECPQCGEKTAAEKIKRNYKKQIEKRIKEEVNGIYKTEKLDYKNKKTEIVLTCEKHGDFKIKNYNIGKIECPVCKKEKKTIKLFSHFKKRAQKKYGERFDYEKAEYFNNSTPILIYDTLKDEYFFQTPASHLVGKGNPNDKTENIKNKLKMGKDEFIRRAREVHGDKYDYSKVEYINNRTKICIICPEHGEFWQIPSGHLLGKKCLKCSLKEQSVRQSMGKEEFIERAVKIHGNKYNYSKIEYINNHKPICIICPKHGEFLQAPIVHLNGCGCKQCGNTSIMETEIMKLLENNKIPFEYQKRFDWLKDKKPLSLDFYLPEYNVAIECQGEQHYRPYKFFGGEVKFIRTQERDELKNKICSEHGIRILYYTKYGVTGENIFKDKNEILKEIKK